MLWDLINCFLIMTFENGKFYRIEAFQFDLSSFDSLKAIIVKKMLPLISCI